MLKNKQAIGLVIAIVVIVVVIKFINMGKAMPLANAPIVEVGSNPQARDLATKAFIYEKAKEITTPDGFVNTDGKPVKIEDYLGKKVVLLDIWTYSCINCIRTLPYLNEWYKKYEDKGFVIIGLHTPEFEFEKDIENVKAAVEKFGIKFPVVLDNDYSTWQAYRNLYWPRKYLIDIDGFIRYDHIGEGGYEETEKKIQELLKERAAALGEQIDIEVPVMKADGSSVSSGQSPETYFGSARNELLANGERGRAGEQTFVVPKDIAPSKLYLGGTWSIDPEYAESKASGSAIVYRFKSKKVFLVMSSDIPQDVEVLVDGKLLGDEKGKDVKVVDGKSFVSVSDSTIYEIYSGSTFGEHTIEFKAGAKGLKAFAFTFGN